MVDDKAGPLPLSYEAREPKPTPRRPLLPRPPRLPRRTHWVLTHIVASYLALGVAAVVNNEDLAINAVDGGTLLMFAFTVPIWLPVLLVSIIFHPTGLAAAAALAYGLIWVILIPPSAKPIGSDKGG